MWSRIVSVILSSLGSNVASRSEEDREFFQSRLILLSRVGCVIGFAALAYHAASVLVLSGLAGLNQGTQVILFCQLASGILLLSVWQGLKRRRLGAGALRFLDAGIGIALSSLFAASLWLMEPIQTIPDKPLLAAVNLLMIRAILLPSTALWTFLFGLLCSVPVIVLSGLSLHRWMPGSADFDPGRETAMIAQWMSIAVGVSTVTSAVIYRLRRSAYEALKLGQYTLEQKLGEGGMGIVYRARHALLRRPTAVKLLRPESASEAGLLRFEREVQSTSRLTHPNTIAIYDYGRTPDGIFYYAMEYLEGLDLERLVRDTGPLPQSRVVHLLKQVAASLVEAHEAGLVHRDIKPGNVFLCERGGVLDVVKVLDFGLVQSLAEGDSSPGEESSSRGRTIAGTPSYIAPEALRPPLQVDARSDLYAVGAMAYFLLTGRPPFTGGSIVDLFSQHLHALPDPPSSHANQPLSPGLDSIILRCLEKDPGRRPRNARELLELLESVIGDGVAPWTQDSAREWWSSRSAAKASQDAVARARAETADALPSVAEAARALTVVAKGR